MATFDTRKRAHRIVMTIGMALLLIGVVLLTVADRVFVVGIGFLGVGSLFVLFYLLVMCLSCLRKTWSPGDVEVQSEAQARSTAQPQAQTETDNTQYETPRYEDVIVCGPARVWTVTFNPGTEPEPPPYSELPKRQEAIGEIQLPRPALLRISSDIHEFKSAGVIIGDRFPEPLTPPPTYNDVIKQYDDVFEPSP